MQCKKCEQFFESKKATQINGYSIKLDEEYTHIANEIKLHLSGIISQNNDSTFEMQQNELEQIISQIENHDICLDCAQTIWEDYLIENYQLAKSIRLQQHVSEEQLLCKRCSKPYDIHDFLKKRLDGYVIDWEDKHDLYSEFVIENYGAIVAAQEYDNRMKRHGYEPTNYSEVIDHLSFFLDRKNTMCYCSSCLEKLFDNYTGKWHKLIFEAEKKKREIEKVHKYVQLKAMIEKEEAELIPLRDTLAKNFKTKVENSMSNRFGLYPHEIFAIFDSKYYSTQGANDITEVYGSRTERCALMTCGTANIVDICESLTRRGFLEHGDVKYTLERQQNTVLSEYLKRWQLKYSGKKAELVNRIICSIPLAEIEKDFPQKYYIVTPKGSEAVSDSQHIKSVILFNVYNHMEPKYFGEPRDIWEFSKIVYQCESLSFKDLLQKLGYIRVDNEDDFKKVQDQHPEWLHIYKGLIGEDVYINPFVDRDYRTIIAKEGELARHYHQINTQFAPMRELLDE